MNHQLFSLRAHYALLIFFFLTLVGVGRALSQSASASWTWEGGYPGYPSPGIYGTMGVPAPRNTPRARSNAVSWTDASGVLWLFGGSERDAGGSYSPLNDLWKYDGTNWTWVSGSNTKNAYGTYGSKGIPASANVPGARYNAMSWTDASGALWLFGGEGRDANGYSGFLNDLWKYNTTKNEWTWVSGSNTIDTSGTYGTLGTAASTNVPGARNSAVSWTDASGVLWLFGGEGRDANGSYGRLNDLWKYDGTHWTWVSGNDAAYASGIYGTQGTAASDNVPGARQDAVSWTDASGGLWLFGGYGRDASGSYGSLNDLWKYDGTNWTWVDGSNTVVNISGNYGTKGMPATDNIPGARNNAVSWTDASGGLWLFGGYGRDANSYSGFLNDLWKYDGTHWTWVSGSNIIDASGIYGTQGTAASDNVPGARSNAVSWTDASGVLWLFGGEGLDAGGGSYSPLNDLWKYDGTNWTWVSGSNTVNISGNYGTKGMPATDNIPGARSNAVSWTDASGVLWLFGGYRYDGASGNYR